MHHDCLGLDLLQLPLEVFRSPVHLLELLGLEHHRNDRSHARQEVLRSIGRRSRVHANDSADGQHRNIRPVEFVDQLHIAEEVGRTGVVQAHVMVWDVDDIAACAGREVVKLPRALSVRLTYRKAH